MSSSSVAGPVDSVSSSPQRHSSFATRFGTASFRPMKVCSHMYSGIFCRGDLCTFAHFSLELRDNADVSQYLLACELDNDDVFEESGA